MCRHTIQARPSNEFQEIQDVETLPRTTLRFGVDKCVQTIQERINEYERNPMNI